MALKLWQKRLVAEYQELKSRISRLFQFAEGDIFAKLSVEEQYLLSKQEKAMREYQGILRERIVLCGLENEIGE